MRKYEIKHFTVKELLNSINNEEFILPLFQRKVTWKVERKKALIKTLRDGDPIGMLLFSCDKFGENTNNIYQIIDGQQRLTTLKEYHKSPDKFIDYSYIKDDYLEELIKNEEEKMDAMNYSVTNTAMKNRKEEYASSIVLVFKKLYEKYKEESNVMDSVMYDFSREIESEFEKNNLIFSREIVKNIITDIKNAIDLPEVIVPVTVYKGSNEKLADIFYNVNTGSVNLSKYETFAAKWYNTKMVNTSKEMYEYALKKYKTNDSSEQFEFTDDGVKNTLNLFEYCLATSEMLSESKKGVYFKNTKKDSSDIAFELISIVLTGYPNATDSIKTVFGDKEEISGNQNFFYELYNAVKDVNSQIENELCWVYQNDGKSIINSGYLLHNIFVSIFFELYRIKHSYYNADNQKVVDINFIDRNIRELKGIKSTIEKTGKKLKLKYVPINILYLELTKYWVKNRQVSDMYNVVSNEQERSIIFNKIPYDIFKKGVHEFIDDQNENLKYRKSTVQLDNKTVAFLLHNMMCKYDNKYDEIFIDKSKLEVDHIVPKSILSSNVARSSAANLVVLDKKSNMKKTNKDLYSIINENVYIKENEILFEKILITKEEFIDFKDYDNLGTTEIKNQVYNSWLKKRTSNYIELITNLYKKAVASD